MVEGSYPKSSHIHTYVRMHALYKLTICKDINLLFVCMSKYTRPVARGCSRYGSTLF